MALILGIETSCDETAAAVYDTYQKKLLSNSVFSQVALHEKYGGVVPEIASRSHLEKIGFIVRQALDQADVLLDKIDAIAVTNKPGLAGALLVGVCFGKSLAWAQQKKLIAINHLEGHIFSSFLRANYSVRDDIGLPHISLVASGGHTSFYLVHDFGCYELLGQTLDDAAGEAFDKVAKLLNLGYPGGPRIEQLAKEVDFKDFFSYPRTKDKNKTLNFSFSGLKTAVLYDLVKKGVYDLKKGVVPKKITKSLQQQVSSSLLVCVLDIIQAKVKRAFALYPEVKGFTFTGGVACNTFLKEHLAVFCQRQGKQFVAPPRVFAGDNAAMIAFIGGYKFQKKDFSEYSLDIFQ